MVLCLLTAGCSRQKSASQKGTMGPSPAKQGGPKGKSAVGSLSVRITPASPKVTDSLRAVVRNGGKGCTFRWLRNGNAIAGQRGDTLPDHNFLKGDEITVQVSEGAKSAQSSTTIVDSPPQVISVPFVDPHAHHGVDLVVKPEGADPDGDPVSFHYIWFVNGNKLANHDSPVLRGDEFQKGDRISLEVIPSDGESEGPIFYGKEFDIPDAPPRFVSTPPKEFKGFTYEYDSRAKDADGDPITYSLKTAPSGMTIDAETGRVVWKIGENGEGRVPITIVAQDSDGMKAAQHYVLNINISK